MKRLPLSIIFLIIFLVIFLTLGQISLEGEAIVNINLFVVVLVTVAMASTIIFRSVKGLDTARLVTLWGLVYFVLKLAGISEIAFWRGNHTYGTLVEFSFLVGGILITRWVGLMLVDFEKSIENFIFTDIKRTHYLEDSLENIHAEVYRSRRFNHPLSIIMVKPVDSSLDIVINQTIREVANSLARRYANTSLARSLSKAIRRCDQMFEEPQEGRFMILSPETDKPKSARIVEYIHKAAGEIGAEVAIGVTSFPEDALTVDEMLRLAEKDMIEKSLLKDNESIRGDQDEQNNVSDKS